MKTMLRLLMCAVLLGMTASVQAQKVSKEVQKEAKEYKKKGWEVTPGAPPLERQLELSYKMQQERDEDMQPKYIMATSQSVGQLFDAARLQANSVVKQELASQAGSLIKGVVDAKLENEQLTAEQAASVEQVCSQSTAQIAQKLGRVIPVMELQRKLPNGNVEVLIRAACIQDKAVQAGLGVVGPQLQQAGLTLQ